MPARTIGIDYPGAAAPAATMASASPPACPGPDAGEPPATMTVDTDRPPSFAPAIHAEFLKHYPKDPAVVDDTTHFDATIRRASTFDDTVIGKDE
ncbi:MAG: hypothetical protein P4M00_06540 [Azospirillaceae bacterium]|nr:hypothetical protein [Azospirillaceae bacterium]